VELSATIFPAIATVTAAFVAGGVAFLSAVLSKEQKTSEFRYAWLNSVLDDIAKFVGAAESISATAWSHFKSEGKEKAQAFLAAAEPQIRELLAAYYRARIRLYPQEHQEVLQALERVQVLLLKDDIPDPAIQFDLLGGHFQLPAGHLKGRRILKDRNRLMRPIVVGVKDDPMAVRRLGFLIRGGEVGSHELDP